MSIVDDYRVPQKPAEPFPEHWEPAAIFQAIDRLRRKPEPVPLVRPSWMDATHEAWTSYRKANMVTYIDLETRLMGDDWWAEVLAIAVKEGDDPVKFLQWDNP